MAQMPSTINTNVTATITVQSAKQRAIELAEELHLQARETGSVDAEKLLDLLDLIETLPEQWTTWPLLPQQPQQPFDTFCPTWPASSNTCSACAQSGVCNCVRYPGSFTC